MTALEKIRLQYEPKKRMIYRIEFNEKQQHFHLEGLNKKYMKEENTYGWKTIGIATDYIARLFISDSHYAMEPPLNVETLKSNFAFHIRRIKEEVDLLEFCNE